MSGSRGVVVLGMHRSGTSLVTGLLAKLGLHLPAEDALYAPSEFNPRGNQEVMELTATNERLMHALGGEWSAPPEFSPGWEDEPAVAALRAEAEGAYARFLSTSPWVWKDPRLCLMLGYWQQLMATAPLVVLVVRNPLETAASLARRDAFSTALSMALWERYQRAALAVAAGHWVAATTYEDVLADPAAWLAGIAERLAGQGLPLRYPGDAAAAFADRSFRHAAYTAADLADHEAVSPQQRALYELSCALPAESSVFAPPVLPAATAWATALLDERRAARAEVRRLRAAREPRSLSALGAAAARRVFGSRRRDP